MARQLNHSLKEQFAVTFKNYQTLGYISMKILTNMLLLIVMLSGPVYAKDKQSSLQKALRDEISGDSDKGKGKPDNPGEHGRDNAAEKQRENQGKGSKGDDSWESAINDAFDDDDEDNKGKKGNNKKK